MPESSSTSSKSRSSGPVLRLNSPAGKFQSLTSQSPSSSSPSLFASSTSAHFYSPASSSFQIYDDLPHYHRRSVSPTRINVYSHALLTPSVRFPIDHRSISPSRSIAVTKHKSIVSLPRKSCMCSPTTHPGSFRCSLHKNNRGGVELHQGGSFPSTRLNMRRSAMTNSIVRIGSVEGELVRRALTSLIRPSSHQLRRRTAFHPRPSRLSVMSKAEQS